MLIDSKAIITGVGAYVPERILTNQDLEKLVETSDDWIIRRTGMSQRHISKDTEFASDLAILAVQNLIDVYGVQVSDVDMIIVSTCSPDHFIPNVASLIQGHFGMKNTGAVDVNVACTGYIYALSMANAFITIGQNKKILVIAAETISKIVDYTDRNTCVLFGDGAAAFLLERTEGKGAFIASHFGTEGSLADKAICTHLSKNIRGIPVTREHLIDQDGRSLYEFIMKNIPGGIAALLDSAKLSLSDINWFIPHSANIRMIQALGDRLEYPSEQTLMSANVFGNTSSASIPLAIWLALKEGIVVPGDKLLLYGFGGGLTHAGVIIEW